MHPIKQAFICVLLAAVALNPMWSHSGLPDGADVTIHYWRTVDLEHTWRYGDLLARWSELYYYGYGAPSFSYTAPGFYALAVMVGWLPGVDDIARVKLILSLGVLVGVWGAFRYSARRWGIAGGLLSAAAFAFAPMLIFQEPMARASFGVVFGMGCAAAAIAALDDLVHTRRGMTAAVLALCGLLLSHNLTAVAGMATIAGWLLWNRRRAPFWAWGWGAFAVACGLCGFFWIPVLLERGWVRVDLMITNEHLDWRRGFIPLTELLRWPERYDTRLLNNGGHPQLGVIHTVLALSGIGVALWRTERRREGVYWVLVTVGALFLVTPYSAPLWNNVATLQQFLFPLRFLNIAALGAALLVGGSAILLRRAWSLALVAIVLSGLYLTTWDWRAFPADGTPAGYIAHEIESGVLGGTADNEFLPPSVALVPPPTAFVEETVAAFGTPVQRVNPFVYPTA
ncbi:MAG: hypothetical protein AAF125_11870, partial [Chloroflexota bacterium]